MLNVKESVGDRLTLKYHSDRKPSDWIKRKLVITVTRARELVPVVRRQLEVASSPKNRVGADSLIEQALQRHFALTLRGDQVLAENLRPANKYHVAKVITGLREIEEGLSGELTLSDLLSPTKWDPHNAYATANLEPLSWGEEAKLGDMRAQKIAGAYRPGFDKDDKQFAMGFVQPKKKFRENVGPLDPLPEIPANISSIHLQFAVVESCSTWANVTLLVHEASHKFARTQDWNYATTNSAYDTLKRGRAILEPYESVNNADSYAFFCISLGMGRVVKDGHDLYTSTAPEPPYTPDSDRHPGPIPE
jgi:hypothetical protein